jgi:diacylglycerol kinase family enzyme
MIRAAAGWVFGRWSKDREIIEIEGSDMTLSARGRSSLPVMIDGEALSVSLPIRAVMQPAALKVLAPDGPG